MVCGALKPMYFLKNIRGIHQTVLYRTSSWRCGGRAVAWTPETEKERPIHMFTQWTTQEAGNSNAEVMPLRTIRYIPSTTVSLRTLARRLSVGKCFNFCCKSFLLFVISSTGIYIHHTTSMIDHTVSNILIPLFFKSAISFLFSPRATCSSVSLRNPKGER